MNDSNAIHCSVVKLTSSAFAAFAARLGLPGLTRGSVGATSGLVVGAAVIIAAGGPSPRASNVARLIAATPARKRRHVERRNECWRIVRVMSVLNIVTS